MAKNSHPVSHYLLVYVVLLALLGLTIGASYLNIGRYPNNIIAMGIAIIKMLLIILIFMHMKSERWITWFFAAAGMVWLCIMISLMMTDYLSRNHPPNSSPKGEPMFVSER